MRHRDPSLSAPLQPRIVRGHTWAARVLSLSPSPSPRVRQGSTVAIYSMIWWIIWWIILNNMIWSKCHATSGSKKNWSFQCRDAFRNPFHPSAVTGRCRNYLARSQLLPAPVCLLGSALATKKFLGQKSIQTSSLWETVCLSGKSINIYI